MGFFVCIKLPENQWIYIWFAVCKNVVTYGISNIYIFCSRSGIAERIGRDGHYLVELVKFGYYYFIFVPIHNTE